MKSIAAGAFAAILLMAAGAVTAWQQPQSARTNHNGTQAEMDRWKKELSNWGRWGKDDEKGTLNLITSAKTKAGGSIGERGFSPCRRRATPPPRRIPITRSRRRRWEFLVTAAPLPLRHGTGSPINPTGLF